MQRVLVALVVLTALAHGAMTHGGAGHPIEKVVGLLQDLADKVKGEGQQEEITYTEFERWCANSEKTLNKAIAAEKESIDTLENTVESKTKEQKALEEQIAELEVQISKLEAGGKEAEAERKRQAEIYAQEQTDLKATLDAIDQALKALGDSQAEVGGAALLQQLAGIPLVMAELSAEQLSMLSETPRPDLKASGDYAAHEKKYTFKSGNIIELLKELKTKFQNDQLESTKAETNAQNGLALSGQARQNALDAATASKDTKVAALAEVKSDLSEAEGSLKDAKLDLEADTATLEETQKSCSMKQSEWAERGDTREKELAAISAAIKILAKVAGVRTEAPSNPVPPPAPVGAEIASLLQVPTTDPKMRAVNLLRKEAKEAHSKELDKLAQEVAAHLTGPFDNINNMLQKMLFRLMAEQKDEDDHKNWCDIEIEKTNSSATTKEDKIDSLTLKIEDAEAKVKKLLNEVADASEMVANIVAHVQEATAIREAGKAENALAIRDAEDAQAAIVKAIAVLEEFYKDSGMVPKEPWEFLQKGVELPEKPSTWEASYTGAADPTKQPDGIITVLKEVQSDFGRMEADTRAQEEMDQKADDEEMKRCSIEKSRRQKETEMKTQESKRLGDRITSEKKSRSHTSQELVAVKKYMKDLQPACVEGDSTYDDRKAARASEIAALKQAQEILKNAFEEDAASAGAPAASAFLSVASPLKGLA